MFVLCSRENISYHFRTIQPLEKVAMRDDVAAQSGYNKVKLSLRAQTLLLGVMASWWQGATTSRSEASSFW